MTKTKKPEKLWAIWSLKNEISVNPRRVTWDKCSRGWWNREKTVCIIKIGLDNSLPPSFTFASEDKNLVRTFVQGYKMCARKIADTLEGHYETFNV